MFVTFPLSLPQNLFLVFLLHHIVTSHPPPQSCFYCFATELLLLLRHGPASATPPWNRFFYKGNWFLLPLPLLRTYFYYSVRETHTPTFSLSHTPIYAPPPSFSSMNATPPSSPLIFLFFSLSFLRFHCRFLLWALNFLRCSCRVRI